MSLLVAIEGADGAGKATAAEKLREGLASRGFSALVVSFPRYGETVGGVTLGNFLAGRLPVPMSPRALAVLYALDRLESLPFLNQAVASHDVLICDRYIASNMVYQASKVPPAEASDMMGWILTLETMTFGVAPPNLSIYLETPLEFAQELMLRKTRRSYTDRQFDEHEADITLQRNVRNNYARIAADGVAGPWRVVSTTTGTGLRDPDEIAVEVLGHVLGQFRLVKGPNRQITASNA